VKVDILINIVKIIDILYKVYCISIKKIINRLLKTEKIKIKKERIENVAIAMF